MKVHPWAAATAAFAAGSIAAVGIAQATSAPTKIPDSSTGVITACFVKKTGAVRFINAQAGKTCKSGEKKVAFNQKGPQGATGATGATGSTGPSNGYAKAISATIGLDNLLVLPGGPPKNRVVQVTLPAGNYMLQSSTAVHRLGVTTTEIKCSLLAESGTVTSSPVTASVNQQYYDVPLSVTGTYTNTAEAVVYLRCNPAGGPPLSAEGEAVGGTLTATKVADLAVQ